MEIKANSPFRGPVEFEETMQNAVNALSGIVEKHGANLLGTGMHPLMRLSDTGVWPHYHRKIYSEYSKIFNLHQHGWLNIQSFHLNLPYQKEGDAVALHNQLCNLCAYLPAVTASSPFFEGKEGPDIDNRLQFYKVNQKEVPSISGEVIPNYVSSLESYNRDVIGGYSADLARAGASKTLLNREWVNSRGIIFRFDRAALEVRVMDEQECVKSDVGLACFIRASLRGMLAEDEALERHYVLVQNFNSVIHSGLNASVQSIHGKTARQVLTHYLSLANNNASAEEKRYLPLVERRIHEGSLSELILNRVHKRSDKTNLHQAIQSVYSTLIKSLRANQPF